MRTNPLDVKADNNLEVSQFIAWLQDALSTGNLKLLETLAEKQIKHIYIKWDNAYNIKYVKDFSERKKDITKACFHLIGEILLHDLTKAEYLMQSLCQLLQTTNNDPEPENNLGLANLLNDLCDIKLENNTLLPTLGITSDFT